MSSNLLGLGANHGSINENEPIEVRADEPARVYTDQREGSICESSQIKQTVVAAPTSVAMAPTTVDGTEIAPTQPVAAELIQGEGPSDRTSDMPLEVLPTVIRQYIVESANAYSFPVEYIALSLLAALSAAIGNRRCLRIKAEWVEPIAIWGLLVGPSGEGKTPALKNAISLLSSSPSDPEGNAPDLRNLVVTDISYAALIDRLHAGDGTLLYYADELTGWLTGKSTTNFKSDWLSIWSASPISYSRKIGLISMPIRIERPCVSIIAGIQTDVLRRALRPERLENGLLARFLFVMPTTQAPQWSEADVSKPTRGNLEVVFQKLASLEPDGDANGRLVPHPVSLSDDARRLWSEFFNRHSAEQQTIAGPLASTWSKIRQYALRLAMIIHLCRVASEEYMDPNVVEPRTLMGGIRLAEWFGAEAARVFEVLCQTEEEAEDSKLLDLSRKRGGNITARELQQNSRRYRGSIELAESALNRLVRNGYGEWQNVPSGNNGGRPTRRFVLNTNLPT